MLSEAMKDMNTQTDTRLYTLKELSALPSGEETDVPVVLEERYPIHTWDKSTMAKWVGARFIKEDHMSKHRFGLWGVENYNRTWRVWTGLPTKIQREGERWGCLT